MYILRKKKKKSFVVATEVHSLKAVGGTIVAEAITDHFGKHLKHVVLNAFKVGHVC